jgi:drug/metabolite transporter (DMT)-like permease
MSSWLGLAIFAQFLFAVSTLVDKHIVSRAGVIGKPVVYAFFVSLLSGFVIVFLPFVSWPAPYVLVLSLANAATFTAAIFLLYSALKEARASDVSPAIGGLSAIVTAILAAAILEGDVAYVHILPIALLALGTGIISHFHFSMRAFLYTAAAGCFFGITVFVSKLIFIEVPFLDGFFWMRIMNVAIALSLLLVPAFRTAIFHGGRHSSRNAKSLVVGNKILGGVAAALTAYAVSLGSVAVVNALAGLQFLFLFVFALLFAHKMPLFSDTKTGSHGGWHTFVGIGLVGAGLATLYLGV